MKSMQSLMHIFAQMPKMQDNDMGYTEYLHAAHDLRTTKKDEEKCQDMAINLSDFIPEPRSLSQILRMNKYVQEKWGEAIRKEINGLFDNGTFELTEMALPADEVIPVKLALKTKLNSYGGLDKLKARVCLRGDMQIKDESNPWSPTASSRLLRCFIADATKHCTTIYKLDFIQAFIQSDII